MSVLLLCIQYLSLLGDRRPHIPPTISSRSRRNGLPNSASASSRAHPLPFSSRSTCTVRVHLGSPHFPLSSIPDSYGLRLGHPRHDHQRLVVHSPRWSRWSLADALHGWYCIFHAGRLCQRYSRGMSSPCPLIICGLLDFCTSVPRPALRYSMSWISMVRAAVLLVR